MARIVPGSGPLCVNSRFDAYLGEKRLLLSGVQRRSSRPSRSRARRRINWTHRIRPGATTFDGSAWEMTDLLRRERRRLVIKPNDDYGGWGVLIGEGMEPEAWERAVRRALVEPYISQERMHAEKVVMPTFTGGLGWEELNVDFDPFLFRQLAHGGIVRLSTTSLCNVAQGAESPRSSS